VNHGQQEWLRLAASVPLPYPSSANVMMAWMRVVMKKDQVHNELGMYILAEPRAFTFG
jgi:hypothetical protein